MRTSTHQRVLHRLPQASLVRQVLPPHREFVREGCLHREFVRGSIQHVSPLIVSLSVGNGTVPGPFNNSALLGAAHYGLEVGQVDRNNDPPCIQNEQPNGAVVYRATQDMSQVLPRIYR